MSDAIDWAVVWILGFRSLEMRGKPRVQLQYVSVRDVRNNPRNARTHSKRQIRQIAGSIKAFGFLNPILVDKDNKVIAGHGRLAAAILLGLKYVPIIRVENLTPNQIRAYML